MSGGLARAAAAAGMVAWGAAAAGAWLGGCGGHGLRVDSVDPARGTAAGLDELVLRGRFSAGAAVDIGGRAAEVLTAADDALRVRTPAGVAGDADVTVTAPGGDAVTLPAGFHYDALEGRFDDASAALPAAGVDGVRGRGAVAADLDGDGDLDVLQAVRGAGVRVLENDGDGAFTDMTPRWMPPATDDTITVAVGDVDGDGLADLVTANLGEAGIGAQNRLYLARGLDVSPYFEDVTAAAMPAVAAGSTDVVLADADADGDVDQIVADWRAGAAADAPRGVSVLVNDGAGTFALGEGAVPALDVSAFGLAPADFDADGDLDVFVAVDGAPCVLLLNDGAGVFSLAPPGWVPALSVGAKLAAAGDLDGDGAVDVYVPNAAGVDVLLLNDGSGRLHDFSLELLPADPNHSEHAALADLDLDGDLDVVVAKFGEAPDALYLNDGSGRMFDYSSRLAAAGGGTSAAALVADFDADGTPDVLVSVDGGAGHLYLQQSPARAGLTGAVYRNEGGM